MEKECMVNRALELLCCRLDCLEIIDLPELNAVYFRNKTRGGGALIISHSEEVLFVDPFFIPFSDHVARFANGERSEL